MVSSLFKGPDGEAASSFPRNRPSITYFFGNCWELIDGRSTSSDRALVFVPEAIGFPLNTCVEMSEAFACEQKSHRAALALLCMPFSRQQ